jgi:hypothetical protein
MTKGSTQWENWKVSKLRGCKQSTCAIVGQGRRLSSGLRATQLRRWFDSLLNRTKRTKVTVRNDSTCFVLHLYCKVSKQYAGNNYSALCICWRCRYSFVWVYYSLVRRHVAALSHCATTVCARPNLHSATSCFVMDSTPRSVCWKSALCVWYAVIMYRHYGSLVFYAVSTVIRSDHFHLLERISDFRTVVIFAVVTMWPYTF